MMSTRFDVVIFGATGFTGKNTIPSVLKLCKEKDRNYTWAVAGRSESKLRDVLHEVGVKIGEDLSTIPIIIADVDDTKSLTAMAVKSRTIINTCGPFKLYGESVIRACIENDCHHIDVSGEPYFIEDMQLRYHQQAQEKGVYIVSACGFDCIPVDLGLVFLKSQFDGTLNSVEAYHSWDTKGQHKGAIANIGTWSSLLESVGTMSSLKELRNKLFPSKLPTFGPKLANRGQFHSADFNNSWAIRFLGADHSVVQRTQRYLYEEEKMRPVQSAVYFCVSNIFLVMLYFIFGGVFMVLSKFAMARKLLLAYPRFFSAGFFSKDGPSEEMMNNTTFSTTLFGEGWAEKKEDCNEEFVTQPDKKMAVRVSGVNPGYGATTVMLAVSAMAILDNLKTGKLPKKAGVYTTGAAFYHTAIIEELIENGVNFEVLPTK